MGQTVQLLLNRPTSSSQLLNRLEELWCYLSMRLGTGIQQLKLDSLIAMPKHVDFGALELGMSAKCEIFQLAEMYCRLA